MTRFLKRCLFATFSISLLSGCYQKTEPFNNINQTKTQKTGGTTMTSYPPGTLLKAVSNKDISAVKNILASNDYNINEKNADLDTPLHLAIYTDQIDIAKELIDHGADINQQNVIEDSPYLYAGAEGKTDILAYMLEKGEPDLSIVTRYGGNTLIPASEKGHLDTVKLLLKDGRQDINFQNNFGYTALIGAIALTNGSKIFQDIVREFMEHGANKHIKDNSNRTAQDYAEELGYVEVQQVLAEYD